MLIILQKEDTVVYNFEVIITPHDIEEPIPSEKRVLVGGCFDILHLGHVTFLDEAKKRGNILYVAVESDEFMKARKKRKPVHTQEERAFILSRLRPVDNVILLPFYQDDTHYFDLVRRVRPSVIAVTEDDPQLINKKKQAAEVGAKVEVVTGNINNLSSSSIQSYAPFSRD